MQRPVMVFTSTLYGIQMPPAPWQALHGALLRPMDGQMAAAAREEEGGHLTWVGNQMACMQGKKKGGSLDAWQGITEMENRAEQQQNDHTYDEERLHLTYDHHKRQRNI